MKNEVLVVCCTFSSEKEARQIGAALVERQAAACVNILTGLTSIYRWEGEVHQDPEVLALIKTTRGTYPQLEALILEFHSYDEPELIALPVEAGSQGYLSWVIGQVGA